MKNYADNFLKLKESKTVHFVFLRYVAYFIQIINSIAIAKYLGVLSFGVYSFLNLVTQYLNYTNIGIYFALNTILSVKKKNGNLSKKIWETALGLNAIISIVLIVIGFIISGTNIDTLDKYSFYEYSFMIFTIAVFYNFNILFSNLFRVYGKLKQINFADFIGPFLILCVVLYYNDELKVIHILLAILIKNILSLLNFIYYSPLNVRFRIHAKLTNILILRGINLLLYNLSYAFILILARSIISYFYSVEDLGNFSLANSFSLNLVIAVGAFSFLFYPKMIHRFSEVKNSINDSLGFIDEIQGVYVTGINFISIISLLGIPIFTTYLPQYADMAALFKILIVAQIFINSSYGYSVYLIANGKEILLTKIGFLSIASLGITGYLCGILGCDIQLFSFAVIISSLIYTASIIYKVRLLLKLKNPFIFSEFSYRLSLPLFVVLISLVIKSDFAVILAAVLLYIVFNIKQLLILLKKAGPLILKKSAFEF